MYKLQFPETSVREDVREASLQSPKQRTAQQQLPHGYHLQVSGRLGSRDGLLRGVNHGVCRTARVLEMLCVPPAPDSKPLVKIHKRVI